MTIRSAQSTRKTVTAATTKSSTKGMEVVMVNDFEQRQFTNKNRSYSPFSHMGSPTTPLNFDQLFLQAQVPMSNDLSQQDQAMLQAQLLNSMRSTGMAHRPQLSQTSVGMLDQLRQAYNRGEQDEAEWNARVLTAAAHQQQGQAQLQREDLPNEPSSIALLQQKFAQLERHKAEIQKSSQPQQVQIYPSQWPMAVQQTGNPLQSPATSTAFTESRHFAPSTPGFYSLQQQHQHQQVLASGMAEVPEQFYNQKQELNWRAIQDSRSNTIGAAGLGTSPQRLDMGNSASLMYISQQQQPQQFQHQQPKVVDYQQSMHRVADLSTPQQPFCSFQLNGPPPTDMGLLNSVVSSRCDKTGGHSVEINNISEQYSTDDSEMSLDNFSGRVSTLISQQSTASNSSQVPFSNNFHMLPQSSKSAFSTFTRASSNLNPATESGVTTKSLLFNDPYRRMQEPVDMHDDVDTTLHL